jgi:hypothetical protein
MKSWGGGGAPGICVPLCVGAAEFMVVTERIRRLQQQSAEERTSVSVATAVSTFSDERYLSIAALLFPSSWLRRTFQVHSLHILNSYYIEVVLNEKYASGSFVGVSEETAARYRMSYIQIKITHHQFFTCVGNTTAGLGHNGLSSGAEGR